MIVSAESKACETLLGRVTCPENPEPVVMRVFGVQGTQEALDEAEEARSGRDHPEVA